MYLFAYGELCKPSVLRAVLDRVPRCEPALLRGYRRELDTDTGYFRAVERRDAVIAGLLLSVDNASELVQLDDFENVAGGEYVRRQVEVERLIGGQIQEAWAYVAP